MNGCKKENVWSVYVCAADTEGKNGKAVTRGQVIR